MLPKQKTGNILGLNMLIIICYRIFTADQP